MGCSRPGSEGCRGRLCAWRGGIDLSRVFCREHRLVTEGDVCGCMELHGLELHSLNVEQRSRWSSWNVERGQRSWWQARCRGLELGAGWLHGWGAASSCLRAAEEVVFRTKICMDGISSLSDSG